MYRPKAPCKDCPDRTIGCHSSCEVYGSFREELDEYNKEKLAEDAYYNYKVTRIASFRSDEAIENKRRHASSYNHKVPHWKGG